YGAGGFDDLEMGDPRQTEQDINARKLAVAGLTDGSIANGNIRGAVAIKIAYGHPLTGIAWQITRRLERAVTVAIEDANRSERPSGQRAGYQIGYPICVEVRDHQEVVGGQRFRGKRAVAIIEQDMAEVGEIVTAILVEVGGHHQNG